MARENEQDITNRRNVPRFFVEHPHISWVLLLGVLVWGYFGYTSMPQRKDPDIPVRLGVAACPWPGATAQQVEQYITRRSRHPAYSAGDDCRASNHLGAISSGA